MSVIVHSVHTSIVPILSRCITHSTSNKNMAGGTTWPVCSLAPSPAPNGVTAWLSREPNPESTLPTNREKSKPLPQTPMSSGVAVPSCTLSVAGVLPTHNVWCPLPHAYRGTIVAHFCCGA